VNPSASATALVVGALLVLGAALPLAIVPATAIIMDDLGAEKAGDGDAVNQLPARSARRPASRLTTSATSAASSSAAAHVAIPRRAARSKLSLIRSASAPRPAWTVASASLACSIDSVARSRVAGGRIANRGRS